MPRVTPASLPDPQRRALAGALRESYLEVFPAAGIEAQLGALSPGSWVGVTCSPSKGPDATLELTERLVARGLRVVPHVAARMVRDRAHLRGILDRLDGIGVDSLFVVGGDAPRAAGPYGDAWQLLQQVAEGGHRLRHIGVAAHPEGHPAAGPEALLRALEAKQAVANYLVTQMCFDAAVLSDWLRTIRTRGITLPAWIGLPGVYDRAALLATSMRIGVGASLRLLRHRAPLLGRLLGPRPYRPDRLLCDLAPRLLEPEAGIAGFHLFCFNRVEPSENWRRQFIADCGPPLPGDA